MLNSKERDIGLILMIDYRLISLTRTSRILTDSTSKKTPSRTWGRAARPLPDQRNQAAVILRPLTGLSPRRPRTWGRAARPHVRGSFGKPLSNGGKLWGFRDLTSTIKQKSPPGQQWARRASEFCQRRTLSKTQTGPARDRGTLTAPKSRSLFGGRTDASGAG